MGRFALHQVTASDGDHDRLLLIMSFSEKPGMIGSLTRVQDLHGKSTAAQPTPLTAAGSAPTDSSTDAPDRVGRQRSRIERGKPSMVLRINVVFVSSARDRL